MDSDLAIGDVVRCLANVLRELQAAYWELTHELCHFEKAVQKLEGKRDEGFPAGQFRAVSEFGKPNKS